MKENNIKCGVPFQVDVKVLSSCEPILNTFCILEDTAYRSKKWNSTRNLVFESEESDVLFSKKLGTLADIPEIEMEFLDLVKETASELVAEFEKDSEIEL